MNQIELHPSFTRPELRATHARLGIATRAWPPIGGVNRHFAGAAPNPLSHPLLTGLAERYGKTPVQIVLRWHVQHGFCAIPKSVRPERIAENLDIFDVALTADGVAAIDALDTGVRGGFDPDTPDPDTIDIKPFDFAIPD